MKKKTETIFCDFCNSPIVSKDNVEVILRGRVKRNFDLCKGCVARLVDFFEQKKDSAETKHLGAVT